MKGKRVLITGGNSGIGKEAAIALAKQGADIVLACRNIDKARSAVDEIKRITSSDCIAYMSLDLASKASIQAFSESFARQFDSLDVLINNAGLVSTTYQQTVDGFEMTMGVNHLGPFLLTHLLLPLLKAAGAARVVNVASDSYKMAKLDINDLDGKNNYFIMRAYSASKLANILFTRELAERVKGDGVTVNALHPGAVATSIWPSENLLYKLLSAVLKIFLISEKRGAQTTVYLASSGDVMGETGGYFYREKACKITHEQLNDRVFQKDFWKLSERLMLDV